MDKNTSQQEDDKLIMLLQDGDKQSFRAIFDKYYHPLCEYAYHYVSIQDVEEVVQDVLLWIWQEHKTLYIRSSLRAYLFRAVKLRCLTRIEQNTVRMRAEGNYGKLLAASPVTIASDDYLATELLIKLHDAIDKLPEPYKKAFVMHRFNNYSYKEIADKLEISPKTVDYRISHALSLLRRDLKEYFPLFFILSILELRS